MKKLLAMTALTLALASPALAEDGAKDDGKKHHKGGMMFEKMDTNSDGQISLEEFQAFHAEKFKKMDTDGDGVITREETEAAKAKWKEKKGERRDSYKKKKDEAASE